MSENKKNRILVIDDDTRLRNLLGKFLGENNFEVELAQETQQAKQILQEKDFDILIVDVMMPGQDGISFTDEFKKNSRTPVLILTARGEPDDRIRGLEVGAEDYLQKPFEPKELLLRINNILRRNDYSELNSRVNGDKSAVFSFGNFKFDSVKMMLRHGDNFVHLTDSEKKILTILCKNMGQLLSRDNLAEMCGNIDVRSIDVQITRLRRKIEDNPKQPQFLQTVRNQGYVLRA